MKSSTHSPQHSHQSLYLIFLYNLLYILKFKLNKYKNLCQIKRKIQGKIKTNNYHKNFKNSQLLKMFTWGKQLTKFSVQFVVISITNMKIFSRFLFHSQ